MKYNRTKRRKGPIGDMSRGWKQAEKRQTCKMRRQKGKEIIKRQLMEVS